MNKQILYIALAGTLAFGMAGQASAVETFEVAGQKYVVSDTPVKQGKIIEQFEIAGQKYVMRESLPGTKTAELAIFEVIPGVDDNRVKPTGDQVPEEGVQHTVGVLGDRPIAAGLSQHLGFSQPGHCEAICVGQCFGHHRQAVPIRIGFDHCHDRCVRRSLSDDR